MVCLKCGSKTKVINTRPQKRSNQVWRRRLCKNCSFIFTSEEQIDFSALWRVVKVANSITYYNQFYRDKLFLSVYNSCKHRKNAVFDATELTFSIIRNLENTVENGILTDKDIALSTNQVLSKFDNASSSHYISFHPEYF